MSDRLDVNVKQEVTYCIPLWLRDEQVKFAIQRVSGRIQAGERRSEPVAVVGFGPSLNDTWEKIRDFSYVISCSGSHRFLVERGIVPTWHVEVDPRPHKVTLIGPPQRTTQYLLASTCHPAVFDHLEDYDVKLWHVFDNTEDGLRLLPPGEWALTGGCDVGLRAITIAGFLGFRDLHVFGIDGCARDEAKHAADHPNKPKKYAECEYDGVTYWTTPGMLEAARQMWHELDVVPAVRATFYGEGLIQHMARNYRPTPERAGALTNIVAFNKPELISAEYRELNTRLHRENLAYGVGGGQLAPTVLKLVDALKTRSVLDYGCGKGYLAKALPFPIWEYDPAVIGKTETPRPADIVVCDDVLEHVEPERLKYVLDDLRRCTRRVGYFVINTGSARKQLADGRNTHLIQKSPAWWKLKLEKFFRVGKMIVRGAEAHFVVAPRKIGVSRLSTLRVESAVQQTTT